MIGKKNITVVIEYVADYSNCRSYIDDVKVGTSAVGEEIDFATILGILEMAKIKILDNTSEE